MLKTKRKIPTDVDWADPNRDLDVLDMKKLFAGKPYSDLKEHFGDVRSISRMDELLWAPRPIFQYYVHAFGEYVLSEEAKGDSDSASPFLSLLEAREKRDPGSVKEIYDELAGYLEFIAARQEYFEAPIEIYGDFQERVKLIKESCHA